jgi:hypothetical protein
MAQPVSACACNQLIGAFDLTQSARYNSAEEAFPHFQAIVLQEQEAASARASRGEVDTAADADADAGPSASDDKAVNVLRLRSFIVLIFHTTRYRSSRWLLRSRRRPLLSAPPLQLPRQLLAHKRIFSEDPSPKLALLQPRSHCDVSCA